MSISDRTTLPALNRRFAAERLDVELVKGAGYFYFVFEDGDAQHFDTHSIYVFALNHMTGQFWLEQAREFSARRRAELQEIDQ